MWPPKVLRVQNTLGLNASSFCAKFAGVVTAGQCMCYREDFTHWFSNFHSCYMKRNESCLVVNSPFEPKFSESICCQNMVEIHGYNEHISVTGKDDNPRHATFWPSAANKVKLEQLIKGYEMDHFKAHPDNLLIVLSRIVGDETSIYPHSQ